MDMVVVGGGCDGNGCNWWWWTGGGGGINGGGGGDCGGGGDGGCGGNAFKEAHDRRPVAVAKRVSMACAGLVPVSLLSQEKRLRGRST